MFHFCGADPLPPIQYRAGGFSAKERLARALWRKPSPPDLADLLHERDALLDGPWKPRQPNPYFAILTERVMLVCIDTGITGKPDREQGEWLLRVSKHP